MQVGYLHRGFEKMCERGTWAQVFPYVDRLNYVSPMLNNVGYALAVEKLCGLAVPDRCQWYRMALGELARISDHLTCNGAMAMELGAFTPFLWFVKAREMVWDILEEETGARLTHSFGRIGGMAEPAHAGLQGAVPRGACRKILELVEEGEKMLLKNRIFIDRLENVGRHQRRRTPSSLGWTGPCLRATGVAYDIRKAHPYLKYDEVDFDVPVGTQGRHARPLPRAPRRDPPEQAHHRAGASSACPTTAPSNCDDPRVVLPEKSDVYTTIEATIQHFKLIMEGAKVPKGEVYSYTEGGNGELGFYLVSRRQRARPTASASARRASRSRAACTKLIEGRMLSDIVPTFGSLNMIGGECDH